MWNYFVFVDESWTWLQEQYFWLGCLIIPSYRIWEYNSLLQKKYDQILSLTKQKESELLKSLEWTARENFLLGRNSTYEMKFKNINKTTLEWYLWLLSQYFKFEDAKFCALIIDKQKYPSPDGMRYFDVYINELSMLLKNNFTEYDEFVVLPDSITCPTHRNYELELREKLRKAKRNCFWVCRLDSRSNMLIQVVDCMIWAVLYEYKDLKNEAKQEFVNKIKSKTGLESLTENKTIFKPNYFSIWNYRKKYKSGRSSLLPTPTSHH